MVLPPPAPFPSEVPSTREVAISSTEEAILRSLVRLDESLIISEKAAKPTIHGRIWAGIVNHLRYRIAEWFSTALLIQFGWILYAPEEVFPHSPNLSVMATMASEQVWGQLCLGIGLIHFCALTINGTFPGFRFSPHIRSAASFIACFLWFQITMAIFMSGVGGTGLGTYRLVFFLEIWNFLHACQDVGVSEGRRKRNAC